MNPQISEQLLKKEWVTAYKTQIDSLWFQAVQLNSQLYLLEKIAVFPFNVFVHRDHLCWSLIANALYESCLMVIRRIVIDKNSDVLTLRKFKNKLILNAKDEVAKGEIKDRLREVCFDKRVGVIEGHVKDICIAWLAHLKNGVISGSQNQTSSMPIVPVDKLKIVRDAVNDLITALSFDTGRAFIYIEYSANVTYPRGTDSRPDIERVLDLVALNNEVLSMPDNFPDSWQYMRSAFTEKELEQFNAYRRKFGLAPA
jgi:hypothetical protein